MFLLQLSVLYWMNNSLISNIYFPQCLLFSRITHLRRSYICWLDSMRLTPSRETQKILIEMVLTNKTHTHTRARTSVWWKIRLVSMKINDTLFFKKHPLFDQHLLFYGKNLNRIPFFAKIEKTQPSPCSKSTIKTLN